MNVSMKGIVKSFGANDVLRQVDFSVQGGEICALLGENGAGKSTLMNILGGVLQPDQGSIELDGQPVSFHSPAQSLNSGIAFIHQELNLISIFRAGCIKIGQLRLAGAAPRRPEVQDHGLSSKLRQVQAVSIPILK